MDSSGAHVLNGPPRLVSERMAHPCSWPIGIVCVSIKCLIVASFFRAAAFCALALALSMGSSNTVQAAVVVDGKLDEPEWAAARRFDNFKVVEPFRLTAPSSGTTTQARLISTPEGIAVAFIVEQAESVPRVKPRLERDQGSSVDRVTFMIDFDGDGRVAYMFTVGLSGSIRDGVVSSDNQLNTDWDTDWSSAVTERKDGWQVELLIPWSVAPMRGTGAPSRNVKVFFGRLMGSNSELQAAPALTMARGPFVSGFEQIEIPQYRKGLFHYWPYVTARQDLIEWQTEYRAGLDVFWKPSPAFQASATINPDFGQVESDDLVINFDALETFFGDKRPFFTENQSIFDLTTPDLGKLIHTRRIGGDADDGSGISAISAALKVNGSFGKLGYGLLAASEDEEAGRDFYAARLQYPLTDQLNLGWLSTYTERPFLDKTASVHAFDATWQPTDELVVNGQVLASFIKQGQLATDDSGAWIRINWTPSPAWTYELEATHFGPRLTFNDLGYQRRTSLNELEVAALYVHNAQSADALVRSSQWGIELQARSNDRGDRLPTWLIFRNRYDMRRGERISIIASAISTGSQDLISRGNGLWQSSDRYRVDTLLSSRRYRDWTFSAGLSLLSLGLTSAVTKEFELSANWFPNDAFNASLEVGPNFGSDWLIWEGARNFGRYSRRGQFLRLNASWFPRQKHELRLKSEWVAVSAAEGARYQLQPSGQMLATAQPRPDFDVNSFGLQLRYRYLIGPQSDIFLAYSRGGFLRQQREGAGAGTLFQEALDLRDADQLLTKIRYRF